VVLFVLPPDLFWPGYFGDRVCFFLRLACTQSSEFMLHAQLFSVEMRARQLLLTGLAWISSFLISASQEARITDVSYWHPAGSFYF
jgi:hypothetical protein